MRAAKLQNRTVQWEFQPMQRYGLDAACGFTQPIANRTFDPLRHPYADRFKCGETCLILTPLAL